MQHQSPQVLFVENIKDGVKEVYPNARIAVEDSKNATLLKISGVTNGAVHLSIKKNEPVPAQLPYVNDKLPGVHVKVGRELGFTEGMLRSVAPYMPRARTAQTGASLNGVPQISVLQAN
jgi:hypothetical protein